MGILDDLKKKIDHLRADGTTETAASTSSAPTPAAPEAAPPPAEPQFAVPDPLPSTTAHQLYSRMQAGEPVVLLDVRMPWDHEGQHPAGAISMPINELAERVDELDPATPYAVSCYHGYSSQNVVAFLLSRGFEHVENVEGGFSGWAAAGLPIEGKYS